MRGILIVIACALAGYVIVTLLMNTKADDLKPPGDRDDAEPPRDDAAARLGQPPRDTGSRQPPSPLRSLPSPRPAQGTDWTLLLDVPRSASERDIEAAFRRQLGKAEAVGDRDMVERLKQARAAALADSKRG